MNTRVRTVDGAGEGHAPDWNAELLTLDRFRAASTLRRAKSSLDVYFLFFQLGSSKAMESHNFPSKMNSSNLVQVVRLQNAAAVESFIASNDESVVNRVVDNSTPLCAAVTRGDRAIVRLLLAHGADVQLCWQLGHLPLSLAAISGDEAMVQLLLDSNADVNGECDDDHEGDGCAPLFHAVHNGHANVVRQLLTAGADVHVQCCFNDVFDQVALLVAAGNCHAQIVQILLDAGADVAAFDSAGRTALHCAHGAGPSGEQLHVLQMLADVGADVAALDHKRRTPFMCSQTIVAARFFIEGDSFRGDIDLLDDDGSSCPLTNAVVADNVDLARFLLACCANADQTLARDCHSDEMAALLFASGVQPDPTALRQFNPANLVNEIATGKRAIERCRLDLIRVRATDVCAALHSFRFPAWVSVLIVDEACAPFAACVRLGAKWNLVCAAKHFHDGQQQTA